MKILLRREGVNFKKPDDDGLTHVSDATFDGYGESTTCAESVENIEIVKLYTEGLRKRKTIKNYILSRGPECWLFMLRNRSTCSQ